MAWNKLLLLFLPFTVPLFSSTFIKTQIPVTIQFGKKPSATRNVSLESERFRSRTPPHIFSIYVEIGRMGTSNSCAAISRGISYTYFLRDPKNRTSPDARSARLVLYYMHNIIFRKESPYFNIPNSSAAYYYKKVCPIAKIIEQYEFVTILI